MQATQRKKMTPKRRLEALLACNGRCVICGEKILGAFIVDHRIPLWMGGEDELHNLQTHHPECDKAKTAKDSTERHKVKRLIKNQDPEARKAGKREIPSRPFQKADKPHKWPSRSLGRRKEKA